MIDKIISPGVQGLQKIVSEKTAVYTKQWQFIELIV